MPAEFDAQLEITCAKLDRTAKKLKKVVELQGRIDGRDRSAAMATSYDTGVDIVKRSKGGAGT